MKVTEQKDVWWVTVVYMGVEGRDNYEDNRKLYDALLETKEKVGKDKWIIMGDRNGHIGLMNEKVNTNGHMILDFIEKTGYRIQNWELENPVTWRDKKNESAIDYILVNDQIEKLQTRMWKNEDIDISEHVMIGISCRKNRTCKVAKKEVWKEKWNMRNVDWSGYSDEMDQVLSGDTQRGDEIVDDEEKGLKETIK